MRWIVALSLLLGLVAPAEAGFLVPVIFGAAFAATALGGIVAFGFNVIGAYALSYVANKLLAKSPQEATTSQTAGIQLDIRVDADVPMSLLVGYAVTAGSLVYAGTYGKRGQDDNSDLIEVIAFADHECDGLEACFVEGQHRTLGADDGDRGQQVGDYGGKLAVKFYDGRQTTADAFAVAALSGAANQPWTTDFIGTGISYARCHSIYDREKVPGRLPWKFVVRGKPLYDPRKDSTVSGGSGPHRYTDLATHEWTRNIAVIIYNIVRGIYVKDSSGNRQFFYGLEGTSASQLPLDTWFAAMNECDVAVALAGGGTEPQFTAGGEITLDTEPIEATKELLKACGGRFVEIGGIYKLYIGAPGLPVMAIDDGSLIADVEDTFKPLLPLESRINYITGKYTSPADGWIDAVAPARGNDTWRAEDGRRKAADLTAPMVQSGTQMQRVMQQMLNRSRRERRHDIPLPPQAFVLEPGDVIEWTSVRNGYEAKLFELDGADYASNLNTSVSVTEVDPADYDWATTDELPIPDGRLVTTRPAGKVVGGFGLAPFVDAGDLGQRRPAIRLYWDDPQDDDAAGLAYEIRTVADISNVAKYATMDAEVVKNGSLIILGGIQALTAYQLRAKFLSYNAYPTEWSLWLNVTTPDARLRPVDFEEGLRDYVMRELSDQNDRIDFLAQRIASYAADQDAANALDRRSVRTLVEARTTALSASITETAQILEDTVNGRLEAAWFLTLDVAGNVTGVYAFNDGRTSDLAIIADRFRVGFPGEVGGSPVYVFQIAAVNGQAKLVLRADMFADASIQARSLSVGSLSAISADLGTITAGLFRSSDNLFRIDANNRQVVIAQP